ncbi:hypothetical protein Q7C36_001933 [Tachysurus vachellii]|uniref:Uncharacterized protein n=1 Tax=Tachysurus vachellii TaxID=175792 RepID=A0AA88T5Y9_TACVA|nr:hypothetical protein Q7C36_001933 [Tachysurus vachellii]
MSLPDYLKVIKKEGPVRPDITPLISEDPVLTALHNIHLSLSNLDPRIQALENLPSFIPTWPPRPQHLLHRFSMLPPSLYQPTWT